VTKTDKYREYARQIEHEVTKFQFHEEQRRNLCRGDAERWYHLNAAASKRLVLKIIRIVERFE
jgi:hypothetical protein